ncbi:hypothetical protein [Methanoregula sp.]|uniref:hypothetical protein n=1 Tax=Methanoregula sp. TaxID=2052170 RepID=UPI0025F9DF5E|nr:hypothetical protein [Methanoregula sp.]
MTRQTIRRRCPGNDDRFRSYTGNERRDTPLSVLWEIFHHAPSLPVPAVTDTLLQ